MTPKMNPEFDDGMLDRWAQEATTDLAEKGWRDIDPNSMMLIVYTAQRRQQSRLVKKITKPGWWLLGVLGGGLLWWIISSLLGIG